jgi:hypothetical protein
MAWVLGSEPQNARSGRFAARYLRIAGDSHRTKPSSSSVGTRPFGFLARYSGVRVSPIASYFGERDAELGREQAHFPRMGGRSEFVEGDGHSGRLIA